MINIAVFASGEGTNAENLFNYFSTSTKVKIKLVVTNNENAGIVAKAEKYKKNLQIISRTSLNNYTDQLIDFLQTEKTDLIVLAGFLLKVPEKLVKAFPNRIINIHPALLPKFGGKGMYGMNVHKAVLEAGEKESGITVHFVDEEYDKGDVILQATCDISPDETRESLAAKVHQLEYDHFPKAVQKVVDQLS
ncbi:MAG: purN [Bacteroidetes bacterium]|jgi:phosphoribosylglycinamide formyltransferase-1|nr:purN [Bacteroidota bacterium]